MSGSPRVAIAWERGLRKPRGCSAELVRRAVRAARDVAGEHAIDGELNVVFVGDERLAELHDQWLDDPTLTDVITFDLRGEGDDDGPAGELFVSVERAQAVAARRGVDALRELLVYVVHGVLHLSGYDDHDPRERRRMRAAERRALASMGLPPSARASS